MTAEESTRPSRTFRIFVSSTFSDLKAERDALQRFVFPRLRELCAGRGGRFQAIDLRWGVSEEAGLDQRTMPICLGEIERCQRVTPRPNFIVLLGDRYGWRPLPPEIPAGEFTAIEAKVAAAGDKALLQSWYRLDENAVPQVWCLKPRRVEVAEKAGPEARQAAADRETADWGLIEARLHAILSNAIAGAGFDEEARVRFEASATEQEILRGALQVPDSAGHVFCFFRTLETKPGVELAKAEPTAVAVRDFLDGTETDGRFAFDAAAHDRLTALKEGKLRPLLRDNVYDYRATWAPEGIGIDHIGSLPHPPDPDGPSDPLDSEDPLGDCLALLDDPRAQGTLCLDVWRSLAMLIRDELDQAQNIDQLRAEIWAHEDFGRERCRHFVGRAEPLAAIARDLAGGDARPIAIVGEPGSGKSALMARAIEQAQEAHSDALVVYRFIGATPASSDGRALLDSLCRQITKAYDGDPSTIPSEYNDLAVEFGKRLELAKAERPLIVVLDALDQLAGMARGLSWLPAALPANVRLVVSTLPGECEKALLANYPAPDVVTVKPMSAAEAETLLSRWLDHAARALQPAQRKEVLAKFGRSDGLPLYLRLAFEEARLWRSYRPAAETVLHEGVQGLIRENLFPRLSEPANHGRVLVAHALGYLAASRFGLSEDELLDVLSAGEAVNTDFHARSPRSPQVDRLPIVVWSRFYFDLEPYLAERSAEGTTLLAFYHNQLRDAATAECLAGEHAERRHAALAGYFRGRADPAKDRSWTGGYARGLGELPYHLAEAGDKDELYSTLTDFTFLEHKAAEVAVAEHPGPNGTTTRTYAGVHGLQDDYELAIARLGGGSAGGRKPLIVTGVDFGQGLAVRCPWCNVASPLKKEWRGADIDCSNCKGPLRVNEFVVGK
jgi:NACHT domain- and WD repeat-containing protein